jgi:phospholipid/cholesterol/gamma-HCH transport system substrate-binding protein
MSRPRAIANAIGALALIALAVVAGVAIAQKRWHARAMFDLAVDFPRVAGLASGDAVRVQGLEAGLVRDIEPPHVPGQPVRVLLRLDERMRPLVRRDAKARIAPRGPLGGQVVEIEPGDPNSPTLAPGAGLVGSSPEGLDELIQAGRAAASRLDQLAVKAGDSLEELNQIATSVRKGEGTIGRLVQDPEAYDRLVELESRAGRVLHDLEDNLEALKRVWPLSRHFDARGYSDFERTLYQPGAERESQVLSAESLFEPGRAVLTAGGRGLLDGYAGSFKSHTHPGSTQIVIAAFTDDATQGEERARILTEEQALAVRRYLLDHHGLGSLGPFQSRRVAALGCGTWKPPAEPGAATGELPARRVEILLFTPQA